MAAVVHPGAPGHDRLGFAVCLAVALHAAFILGVGFEREPRQPAAAKLEITLAQFRSDSAPDKADFLAQHDQQGSGTLEERALQTTRELAQFQDTAIREVSPQQQAAARQSEASQQRLVSTTAPSPQRVATDRPDQQAPDLPHSDASILQRSLEIASLEAKLDIQRQAYAKRPRVRRLTSVATRRSEDAQYLHNWRTRVEAIGNRNYPEQARSQQIYGDLRLMVALLPNGEVHEIKILQSSGHKLLDEAALRIVHLASPYDPFPAAMRKEVDVLEIIRTWRFQPGGLTSEH